MIMRAGQTPALRDFFCSNIVKFGFKGKKKRSPPPSPQVNRNPQV
jgi:hypothetical protein